MSNLSELLPTGGGQNAVDFVASGTLSSGQTVVLNGDGTVSAAGETPNSAGTPSVFESANSYFIAATFDSANNKVVIAYRDQGNSAYGTAVVGTVSGTNISFGSPVVFESANSQYVAATFDSDSNKVVIAYRDFGNSNYGTAVVGTVSGTSISFGSSTVFESATVAYIAAAFDSSNNKAVIVYADNGNSDYGTAIVGTVSGTSISFGSATVFESAATQWLSTSYDSTNNKIVIAYQDGGNSNYGTAVVGTVSGTGISFGTAAVFESATVAYIAATYDSTANKVVIAYRDDGNSDHGTAIVGTVSGTSISFGSAVVFNSASTTYLSATYDTVAKKVVIAYKDSGNSGYGTATAGVVSGTSIEFNSETVFESATSSYIASTYDSNAQKVVIAYRDDGNSDFGTGVVFTVGSSNAADFIGITAEAISDTATGAVNVYGGINEAQTGLTIGSDYYVQDDGSLQSPTVSAPYNISSPTFVDSFSVASQEAVPSGIAFNNDGTKMFVVGLSGDDVNEYTLSTGFDVSTATYSQNFSVSAQDTAPYGIAFNNDGTKMFIVGDAGDDVNEYTLSTGFDVSTATYSQNFSVSAQDTSPRGIAFNNDGTKMFVVGDVGKDVNEYTLSTGFDLSTASYSQNFSVNTQETGPTDISFNADGTKMFIVGRDGDAVNEYTLSTGFDVSTATYSQNFSVSTQETVPLGITFNTAGTKMFIVGSSGDDVDEYLTGVGSVTAVKVGQAISATTINMMDLT